jgi:hypothetical protein
MATPVHDRTACAKQHIAQLPPGLDWPNAEPNTKRRRRPQTVVAAVALPVVAAVVQPVAKRLSRIEALLLEMRFEQEVQGKRLNALKEQLEVLSERRVSKGQAQTRREGRASACEHSRTSQLH